MAAESGDRSQIALRLRAVHDRIAAVDAGHAVRLIAVAKTAPTEAIEAAVAAGQLDIGESYAQELGEKLDRFAAEGPPGVGARIRWHFIGGLQRNKIKRLAGRVHLWQSVDRVALVDELAKRDANASVLIQVNATGEAQKSGCPASDVGELVARAIDAGLDVQGLMTIGPTPEASGVPSPSAVFGRVRALADTLDLPECSMGMSRDLESAIREGSTMVRVGTDVFGPRDRVWR